jgi:hypothetical protein
LTNSVGDEARVRVLREDKSGRKREGNTQAHIVIIWFTTIERPRSYIAQVVKRSNSAKAWRCYPIGEGNLSSVQ